MTESLTPDIEGKIAPTFSSESRVAVSRLLANYHGSERNRVIRRIIHLAGDDPIKISHFVDAAVRRVVVPLVRAAEIGKINYRAFNPTFKVLGVPVVLHPLEIVSVPLEQLGDVVGSLSDESQSIVAALDELLNRAWK